MNVYQNVLWTGEWEGTTWVVRHNGWLNEEWYYSPQLRLWIMRKHEHGRRQA